MSYIDQLELTPEILRLLMGEVEEDAAMQRPAGGGWSLAQVLEHLSWVEGHVFRARLEETPVTTEAPEPAGDDPEEAYAHFEEQREDLLEYLREHGGPDELLRDWVRHDLSHIRQVAGLVRDLI